MTTMPFRLTSQEVDSIIDFIDDGLCICEIITDADGAPVDYRFLEYNHHFEEMTGLRQAKGRTALEMVPNLEPIWIETYGRVALQHEPARFQQGSEAMGRFFDIYAAPIEPLGRGRFAIKFRDITEMKRAESEREAALVQAQQLLQELNHRVMNSLGTISSIIAMESRSRELGEGRDALIRIQRRVQAVADLYRRLSRSASIDSVCSRDYLGAILTGLSDSIGEDGITVTSEIVPVRLSTRTAVPLGLIVNELVTNSIKYAFAQRQPGTIRVTLEQLGPQLQLTVADDGRGVSTTQRSDSGIGQRLVEAFVTQLGGERTIQTGADGTSVSVRFAGD